MNTADFSKGAAYVSGSYLPVSQACVPVTDWAFTRSDVVYDVVHVSAGGFFRLDDHLARFTRSMQARRLHIPEDRAAVAEVLHRLVSLAGFQESYVAMLALRGRPRVFGSRRPEDCDNYLIAYALPWIDVIPRQVQARGTRLWISSNPRVADASVDPTVKNYQWSDLTTGLFEAIDQGYDTAVLCDADGFVTEGPGFNVFAVKDGAVSTPDRGALQGITRATILELCAAMGRKASVAPLTRAQLEGADEVFATTTAGGPMPIAEVSGHLKNGGLPGPVFTELHRAYWDAHRSGAHVTPVRYDIAAAAA